MKKFLAALILSSLLLVPAIGLAQSDEGAKSPPDTLCTSVRHDLENYIPGCSPGSFDPEMTDGQLCCLLDLMETVVDYMFVILLILAGAIIIWGAFEFVTAAGNAEKITSARSKLLWALVGVLVAFAAKGLVRLVEMILS
jgi:hypothetical protein